MGAAARDGKGRWMLSLAVAILVMAAFIALVSVPPPPVPVPAGSDAVRPAVKIARPDDTDTLLKEEAELRDLRPLFLPTERNAALPEPKLEPGRTVLDSEALKPALPESEIQLGAALPPVATIGGRPARDAGAIDALGVDIAGDGLLGFGRRDATIAPLRPRGAFVEVTAWSDGRRVRAEDLPDDARPANERPWSPLELMAVVDRAGLSAPLVVTEGSRVEEVDLHFRNYLSNSYRIGDRLSPGVYRIVIAP
jgi:hypothetical protein